jgi:hypothetical protein
MLPEGSILTYDWLKTIHDGLWFFVLCETFSSAAFNVSRLSHEAFLRGSIDVVRNCCQFPAIFF